MFTKKIHFLLLTSLVMQHNAFADDSSKNASSKKPGYLESLDYKAGAKSFVGAYAAATGILHLGIGGFHRAHQAVYADDAMAAAGGDWMIEGVSLRHPEMAARLNPQNGLFSVMERDAESAAIRVIGSVRRVHVAPQDPETVLARLADPCIRVVGP